MSRPANSGERSSFAFALCAPLCQDLLKEEARTAHFGLTLAYSRPGLISWKAARELTVWPSFRLAHLAGLALGTAKTEEEALRRLGALGLPLSAVCTWERPDATNEGRLVRQRFVSLEALEGLSVENAVNQPNYWGALVVGREPSEPLFCGVVAVPEGGRFPAEVVPAAVPEGAPSRAYAKIAEGLLLLRRGLRPGEGVVEVGASPGGGTVALLERGAAVVAIDPAPLDPRVHALATEKGLGLTHLAKVTSHLTAADLHALGAPAVALCSDMNLAPSAALAQIERVWPLLRKSARFALITLKMNDLGAVRSLPGVHERLCALGLGAPEYVHLPSHRREIVAVLERR
jgi:hypothetical protein